MLIKIILLLIVLLYLFGCFYMFVLQRNFLYLPPQKTLSPEAEPAHFYLRDSEERVRVWQANVEQKKAILYFGGNAEAVEYLPWHYAERINDYAWYFLNYRGFSGEAGEPSQEALFRDALATYDQIMAQHSEIVIMGRSLGSGVASYVASQRLSSKVILVTPYDSIVNVAKQHYWLFPVNLLLHDRFVSTDYAARITVPTLVLRAAIDHIVPPERTDALIAVMNPVLVEQVTIANTEHVNIVGNDLYFANLKRFLAQ